MDYQVLLKQIEQIEDNYQLLALRSSIVSIQKLMQNEFIDFVILGQFKVGKSSFFNSFVGFELLPSGVIPVTSVVTRMYYGKSNKAFVFQKETKKEISLSQIDEFVTETKNPNNQKQVSIVDIELTSLKGFQGIRFVDTPGIGSVFEQNTSTTENWFTEIGIALIAISVERPLGSNELILIQEALKHSPEVILLLTKVDLVDKTQLLEIKNYIEKQLDEAFGRSFTLYTSSKNKQDAENQISIIDKLIRSKLKSFKKEQEKILNHKIIRLAETCLNYLNLAYQTSLKTESEQKELKKLVFEEKINTRFIQKELMLISENSKAKNRAIIYDSLQKYQSQIIQELEAKFEKDYPLWQGNLSKLTKQYEDWLKQNLSKRLKELEEKETETFEGILNGLNDHFKFFTNSLRAKLSDNIYKVLGLHLSQEEWKPEFIGLKKADISVYRAFDTPIDLLWFLFPMFLFKTAFQSFFRKQIPKEVEKNIYRLTSQIYGKLNKSIDASRTQTEHYIQSELETIENVLSGLRQMSETYRQEIESLKQNRN